MEPTRTPETLRNWVLLHVPLNSGNKNLAQRHSIYTKYIDIPLQDPKVVLQPGQEHDVEAGYDGYEGCSLVGRI